MELPPLDWSVDVSAGKLSSSKNDDGNDGARGCFAFMYACTPLYSAYRGKEGVSDLRYGSYMCLWAAMWVHTESWTRSVWKSHEGCQPMKLLPRVLWRIFLTANWGRRVQPTVSRAILGQVVPGCIRKRVEQARGSKSVSSIPCGVCFGFCLRVSALSSCLAFPQGWTIKYKIK